MLAPVIFFLILSVFFQALAFRTYAHESRWLLTDYLWLLIAATALIFYASKADKLEASRRLPNQIYLNKESDSISSYGLITSVLQLEILEREGKESSNNTQESDSVELRNRVRAAAHEIDRVGWEAFLKNAYSRDAMVNGLTSPKVLEEFEKIDTEFTEASERHDELSALKAKASDSVWNAVEFVLYPFFVAFALAIRLGRTTADYLRKSKQAEIQKKTKHEDTLGKHPDDLGTTDTKV